MDGLLCNAELSKEDRMKIKMKIKIAMKMKSELG